MRILAIPGSVRRDSHNARLLRHAAERAPEGVEIEVWEGLKSIPPYDEDDDGPMPPRPVAELRQAIADADGLLIATPEYNSSIPGVLKNAIDWASRPRATTPLQGKPAAVIGATTGSFGAVWAQAELRKVLGAMGGRVIEAELAVGHAKELLADDRLELSPRQYEQLEEILAELISQAEIEAELAVAA
jgi:chromate reductase